MKHKAKPSSRRWDTDELQHGVGDASAFLPSITQLAGLAGSQDWVTENPEAHLLPGLRALTDGTGLSITSVEVDPDGALVVCLESAGMKSRRELRQAVWALIGGVAELTTHVRERHTEGFVGFDVVTGIPPGDGPFATHGHTLHLRISEPPNQR
jgi:hypothetical protein